MPVVHGILANPGVDLVIALVGTWLLKNRKRRGRVNYRPRPKGRRTI